MAFRENSFVFLKSGIKVGKLLVGRGEKGKVLKVIRKGMLRIEYQVQFPECTLILRENQIK